MSRSNTRRHVAASLVAFTALTAWLARQFEPAARKVCAVEIFLVGGQLTRSRLIKAPVRIVFASTPVGFIS